ncbi:response regulator [Dulcicalothrix desertica]|uniref:response regulator n=1 Tax=Dulcicalothrix desertica TaxID=32056 RepID=UPI00119C66E3|nr:response regulator [Dulcicalothrix desertica]TWH50840.1 phospho-acceptor domain-containing protein [Dulcicalothrix desertica PCC 7102]
MNDCNTGYRGIETGCNSEQIFDIVSTAPVSEGMVLQLADGTIYASNVIALKLLGRTIEQLQGSTSSDYPWQTIHEDGSEFTGNEHPAMVALSTGEPCLNVVMGFYKLNGELVWLKLNSQPMFRSGEVTPYGVVTSFVDITEAKCQIDDRCDLVSTTEIKQAQNERLQRTVLIIDDCLEDIETYRRYLLKNTEYNYVIIDAKSGKQGLEVFQSHKPDLVLLDYLLHDIDGLEFITQLKKIQNILYTPVIVLTGQGSEEVAVQAMKLGASDYLIKGEITSDKLRSAVNYAFEKAQLHQRERIVTQIATSIRQSLNLDVILDTTVKEVRQFLQTDRVLIFRLLPDGSGTVVTESVGIEWAPILSSTISDPCFTGSDIEAYRQGLVTAEADIYTANINPCHVELLEQFSVRANLVVPILQGENLWGLLIAHHCSQPREWQQIEIDLLMQLTTQVGIAIQQGELLESEKAARESAEKANRIKDEFLAVLSHELRSPLNPILGWANLLKDGKLDSKKIAHAATVIERSVLLQTGLIDDLLDVSRILRGKLVLNSSPVNLESIITSALEAVQLSAKVKGIQINTIIEPNFPLALGDSARLHQVVWNLVSNAVKFTPRGGCVSVRLEEINGMAQITVGDTGKGIKQEFLPYIFDYFRQEDNSITRNFGGLGLGLAIARHLVEANGGTICAESAGIGQGATFTVCLPLMASIESDVNNNEVINNSLDLNGVSILVIDDEVDSLYFIAFLLEKAGATVTAVSESMQGLEILARFQPDILISDIEMPKMDGYMLIRAIREQGITIPAIALTAHAGEFALHQTLEAGFQKHLPKPIQTDTLMQVIGSLLINQ